MYVHINFLNFLFSVIRLPPKDPKCLQILAFVDPLSEAAQKMAPLIEVLYKTTSINVTIMLNPLKKMTELPAKRCMHSRAHMDIRTCTQTHNDTDRQSHAHTYTCTHTHTCAHAHTHTRTCTHTHTHTHTHTCTHTHAHVPMYVMCRMLSILICQ